MSHMKSEAEAKFLELLNKSTKTKSEILEQEDARMTFERELFIEQAELLRELNDTGLKIQSVWDLVNTKKKYPRAIAVLIKHLPKKYHLKIKEGIVRALSVKEAQGLATKALIEEYKNTAHDVSKYRWAIGNSVFTTLTIDDIDYVLDIVADKNNGDSRHMFILALAKFPSEKVNKVLVELLKDNGVATYAAEALANKMPSR